MLGLAGVAGLAAVCARLDALRRARGDRRSHARHLRAPAPPPPPVWPDPAAALVAAAPAFPAGFGVRRIYLDAGHGAPGNAGNSSCFCVDEQDFTLGAAHALADRLSETGHFEVRLSRDGPRRVGYRERVEEADAWGADAFLSLHSDVRGRFEMWSPAPGQSCRVSRSAPGFSVLWSDEGDAGLSDRRLTLARAVARRMQAAGLLPYDGAEYTGLYEGDAAQPGVFVDRHAPEQRIFVLRRPTMPSVLIETHHALDPREAARWGEEATLTAFGLATAAALSDALSGPPPT